MHFHENRESDTLFCPHHSRSPDTKKAGSLSRFLQNARYLFRYAFSALGRSWIRFSQRVELRFMDR
jgi:hypothetical protein